jgi:hypothetical protein
MDDSHISVHIAPDTPPEKLLLLARYLLRQNGTVPEIAEQLNKATGIVRRRAHAPALTDAPLSDPALEALWQHAHTWGQHWPSTLAHELQRVVDGYEAYQALTKALPGDFWTFPWSRDQWNGFTRALHGLSHYVLAWLTGTAPSGATLPGPSLLPEALHGLFGHAANLAHMTTLPAPTTPLHGPLPLTTTEQAAIDYAQRHAGARLRPLFTRLASQLETRVLDAERAAVRYRVPHALAARRSHVHLASLLAHDAQSWERDWRRVARTELQDAWNHGALMALLARHEAPVGEGELPSIPDVLVYKIPAQTACEHCLRLWLEPDGAPRIYHLPDVLAHASNEGRPAREWTAQVGPIHPNCTEGPLQEYTDMVEPLFQRMRDTWTTAQANRAP